MSLAWVAEQIRAVREASGELGPNLIRFNPNPPGMVRPGSADSAGSCGCRQRTQSASAGSNKEAPSSLQRANGQWPG